MGTHFTRSPKDGRSRAPTHARAHTHTCMNRNKAWTEPKSISWLKLHEMLSLGISGWKVHRASLLFLQLCLNLKLFKNRMIFTRVSLVVQTVKNPPVVQNTWVPSLGQEDPLEREWLPTPAFLPGEFHEQSSLVGYSPGGQRVRHDWATSTQMLST